MMASRLPRRACRLPAFRRARSGELELPGFADQGVAEADVRLARDEAIAGLRVDAARRQQHAVGPQDDAPVAGGAGEALALVDEARADAEAARRRLDQQQAQLRRAVDDGAAAVVARLDEEDAADVDAVALGDPARFALGVEAVDEVGGDPRDQRFEADVPAVFGGVEAAVTIDRPADVARLRRPELPGDARRGRARRGSPRSRPSRAAWRAARPREARRGGRRRRPRSGGRATRRRAGRRRSGSDAGGARRSASARCGSAPAP